MANKNRRRARLEGAPASPAGLSLKQQVAAERAARVASWQNQLGVLLTAMRADGCDLLIERVERFLGAGSTPFVRLEVVAVGDSAAGSSVTPQ